MHHIQQCHHQVSTGCWIRVSGFVFVRSGRTSLRRSSFWDSCDTPTPSSIKAATWKTTLPGLVGAFAHHLVFYFTMFLVWCSLSFTVAFHSQFLSNHISFILLLSFCKKQKEKCPSWFVERWNMWQMQAEADEAAFCFSWWWSTAWALHQIY